MSTSYQQAMQRWFNALPRREQSAVRLGVIGGGVMVLLVILLILHRMQSRAELRITHKREDLAYIQSVLPELTAAPAQSTGQSLVAEVDDSASSAGLKDALKGTEPSGTQGVIVRFESAPLPALLTWIVRIQREYNAKVTAATIEKTSSNGLVNATVTLVGP